MIGGARRTRSGGSREPSALRTLRPRWTGVLLICGKCVKRCPDGKALRRTLKEAARERLAAASGGEPGDGPAGKRGGKPRVMKVACLGLCPKRALVVASPATLASGEVVLVRGEADVAAAISRLLPARRDEA